MRYVYVCGQAAGQRSGLVPKTRANWTFVKMQDVECDMWNVDTMQYAQLEERVSVSEEKKKEEKRKRKEGNDDKRNCGWGHARDAP